jgi:hypothetical protein
MLFILIQKLSLIKLNLKKCLQTQSSMKTDFQKIYRHLGIKSMPCSLHADLMNPSIIAIPTVSPIKRQIIPPTKKFIQYSRWPITISHMIFPIEAKVIPQVNAIAIHLSIICDDHFLGDILDSEYMVDLW